MTLDTLLSIPSTYLMPTSFVELAICGKLDQPGHAWTNFVGKVPEVPPWEKMAMHQKHRVLQKLYSARTSKALQALSILVLTMLYDRRSSIDPDASRKMELTNESRKRMVSDW